MSEIEVSKRGLIHIPSVKHPQDDFIWTSAANVNKNVTWYYNYQGSGARRLADGQLEFVPMLWGGKDNIGDAFIQDIKKQSGNIRYVLAFNEPDMSNNVGGSDLSPKRAAAVWKSSIEPLKKEGKLLGAPAVAGTEDGKKWLEEFFRECNGCTIDFIPLHWYGDFPSLASHLGQLHETYPDHKLWLTELGYPHQNLPVTQEFFKQATEYLDRLDYVERYAWFGSFRSDVSNVGPNMAMLDKEGRLTDLGSWYLGGEGTGVVPQGSGAVGRGMGGMEGWGVLLVVVLLVQMLVGIRRML